MITELERLLAALERCQKGWCGNCEYTEKCMDGLIDDAYNFLKYLYDEYLKRISEKND